MSSPTPIIKGITTIRWGAGSQTIAGVPTPYGAASAFASAIVVSLRHSRMGGPPTLIADTAGFTQIWVGLNDGDHLELQCVDDQALSWPAFGADVTMYNPGDTTTKVFICEDDDIDLARKREGMRTVKLTFYASGTIA